MYRFWGLLCAALALVGGVNLSLASDEATSEAPERFRNELIGFFAEGSELAPTVLGDLAGSPGALEAIEARIRGLGADELAELEAALAEVPGWRSAPEALTSALPRESLQRLRSLARQAEHRARDLDAMRGELASLYAALELFPDSALERMQLDREAVRDMHRDLRSMDRDGLAAAATVVGNGAWRQARRDLFSVLPIGLTSHAERLAARGPLDEEEIRELGEFRGSLDRFLGDVATLPPAVRGRFDAAAGAELRRRLTAAAPEALLAVREALDPVLLQRAMEDVRLLTGAGSLDDAGREALVSFRGEFRGLLENLAAETPDDESWRAAAESLSGRSEHELLLVRSRVEQVPDWRRTLPHILRVAGSETLRRDVTAAANGTLSEETRGALETFRERMRAHYAHLSERPDVDREAAADTASWLASAHPPELAVLREVFRRVPGDERNPELFHLPRAVREIGAGPIVDIDLDCRVSLGSIKIPLPGLPDPTVSLGSIDLNFICTPLENAINAVEGVVNSVAAVIDDVFNAVIALPQTMLDLLQSAFTALADAALGTFTPQNLQNALGLVGNFWENLPQAPQIPCPPDGTQIPFFGEVGDQATAAKYGRYLWVFDKVLGLIPDTEISLALKIPAQVLYGGVEYLGVCLDSAAEARDEAETEAFRAGVDDAFTATRTELGQARLDILEALRRSGADLQDLLAQLDARVLRLAIEDALSDSESRVAAFLLPEAFGGHLELVREITDESITMAETAGGDTDCARNKLLRGDEELAMGDYRKAFDRYREAYRAAAKAKFDDDDDDDDCDDDDDDDEKEES